MKTFTEKCHEKIRQIPRGKVTTYSEVAKALNTKAIRAVGSAMKKNKDIPRTPCHRVIKTNGEIGEYIHGTEEKKRILKSEGLEIEGKKIKDFKNKLYRF
jgi:methylated-DNA-[protein]-cysteine S-methyltransferase